jgi:lipopolysaccharide assembly protein A
MTTEPQHADQPTAPPSQPTGPPGQPTAPPGQSVSTVPDTPAPTPPRTGTPLPHHTLKRTRISGTWTAVACFAVVLLLLLIFILQNSRTVDVSYFGAHGHLPLGVALLLAAVAGVLLIALPGGARILQLRATARRHRQADSSAVRQAQPPAAPSDHA